MKAPIPYYSLWKQWKEDNERAAEDELVRHYLPLVDRVVSRMKMNLPYSVDREELTSLGRLGLLDALRKFDLQRGLQFETYAVQRIRGAVIDGLRSSDWAPRSVREKSRKVEEAVRSLEQVYGRTPTPSEISARVGISAEELRQHRMDLSFAAMASLDEPVGRDDEKQTLLAGIVDHQTPGQEEWLEEEERKRFLAEAVDRLAEKEKLVVSLYYYEELNLSEIAEVMGLTPGRISQLHSKAVAKLRDAYAKYLKD